MFLNSEQARKKFPNATIGNECKIHESAVIEDFAVIRRGVYIGTNAVIRMYADIGEYTRILRNTDIGKDSLIRKNTVIFAGANTRECACILEDSKIGGNRKSVFKSLVVIGLGNTKNMTAYTCDDGLIVNIGCANDWRGLPINEMRELISKKYDSDHEYFDAMNLIEKWYKNL